MKKNLILLAGLPGTGKTTIANYLKSRLENYEVISQNEMRRKDGMQKMPKTQDKILRLIDGETASLLNNNYGVIIDSVNRYLFRRHQLYGVASCCGADVLTLEVYCSEKEAKKRIKQRPKGDGLISDPNDPKVYDRLSSSWQEISSDFEYPGEEHVSYIKFNSENGKMEKVIIRKKIHSFVNQIEMILKRMG